MPISLEGINVTPRSDTLNAINETLAANIATIGAGVANTVVQSQVLLPFQYKIRKVSVLYTTIDAVAGLDSFNLVLGAGAYTQNNPLPNDNSFDPLATTTVGINGLAQYVTPPILGGVGYPTNVGVAGQSVFTTDVPFGPLAGTYNAASPNTQVGFISLTTAGGYGIFVPTNFDQVYPENVPLTLRVTTTAGTGAITGLQVRLCFTPIRKRVAPVGSQPYAALPGVDY